MRSYAAGAWRAEPTQKEDANVVARDCSAAHLENAGGANRAIISTVIALAVMTDW